VIDGLVTLADATDPRQFGAKAANLARALVAGLPVPDGVVLAPENARSVQDGAADVLGAVVARTDRWDGTLAVRSSAVGEDGPVVSFAGQHVTRLGVRATEGALRAAITAVAGSVNSPHAVAYRRAMIGRHGPGDLEAGGTRGIAGVGSSTGYDGSVRVDVLGGRPDSATAIAALIQPLVHARASGVMFTVDPVTGARQLLVEAVHGLGEAVVGGQVTPESWRIGRGGVIIGGRPGRQAVAIEPAPGGGTWERPLTGSERAGPCLEPGALRRLTRLAADCRTLFGSDALDIEWAWARRRVWLLQCRPVTA
jgi:pyruvate,water dikinase